MPKRKLLDCWRRSRDARISPQVLLSSLLGATAFFTSRIVAARTDSLCRYRNGDSPLRGIYPARGLAALLLIALAAPLNADQTVRLAVERDRITAGDLARVMPAWGQIDPSSVVAYAPRPGIQRRVKPGQIRSWARRFGIEIETANLPAAILISRRMRRLEADEAAERLTQSIARRYRLDPEQVRVTLDQYFEPLVPATPLHYKLAGDLRVLNKTVLIPLRWQDADGQTGRLLLRAAVSIRGTSAKAREPIAAGTELSPEDFVFRKGSLPGSPARFLLRPDDIEGKELKSALKAGDTLEVRMLLESPTVRRGDLIELRLRSGGVSIRTPGRAEQSGSIGDHITCRNLESGRRVEAKIVDAKLAEVAIGP